MKSRKAQSFLFEPAAFAGDPAVLAMRPMEVGAYILLLCAAWTFPEPGVIPDNDTALSHLTRTGQDWPQCRAAVSRAFDTKSRPGFWVQKRMVATHAKQYKQLAKWLANDPASAVARGRLGGIAKARNKLLASTLAKPSIGTGSGTGSGSGSGKEKSERPRARPVLALPTLPEAIAFAKANCPTIDGERWWHYQVARGWRTKAGPIVNWHSAMRTWVNNGYDSQGAPQVKDDGTKAAEAAGRARDLQRQKFDQWRKEAGE